MAQEVSLTASLRSNLLSLQGTQKLLDQTQLRLATGKKVNSALDNANSFFASQSLTNRANDLSRLQDGIGQSIQVIKAADDGITAITAFLEQARAIAQEALDQANASGGAPEDLTSLDATYTETLAQIDNLAGDSGYRGTNLLNGGTLNVSFNEDGSSSLTVTGVTFDTAGLSVATASLADATAAQAAIDSIDAALSTVRAQARSFGTNLNIIQAREDFTASIINTLKEGSDKLTLADSNEEGAKLLALQTQQQLGITSLSLASQAQQAVLSLF